MSAQQRGNLPDGPAWRRTWTTRVPIPVVRVTVFQHVSDPVTIAVPLKAEQVNADITPWVIEYQHVIDERDIPLVAHRFSNAARTKHLKLRCGDRQIKRHDAVALTQSFANLMPGDETVPVEALEFEGTVGVILRHGGNYPPLESGHWSKQTRHRLSHESFLLLFLQGARWRHSLQKISLQGDEIDKSCVVSDRVAFNMRLDCSTRLLFNDEDRGKNIFPQRCSCAWQLHQDAMRT